MARWGSAGSSWGVSRDDISAEQALSNHFTKFSRVSRLSWLSWLSRLPRIPRICRILAEAFGHRRHWRIGHIGFEMTKLRKPAAKPKISLCENGHTILITAHKTCGSFLESFEQIRRDRNARGTPTDKEQDLLRAMLVFASSGLDAVIKQLVADALPTVLNANNGENGAAARFTSFVEKHMRRSEKGAAEILSRSITSISPRETLIQWFQRELTSESLQSKDQVFQLASYFDIPTPAICKEIKKLEHAFSVRNQIIHELDVDLKQKNRNRAPRRKSDIVADVNILLETSEKFLHEVDKRSRAV